MAMWCGLQHVKRDQSSGQAGHYVFGRHPSIDADDGPQRRTSDTGGRHTNASPTSQPAGGSPGSHADTSLRERELQFRSLVSGGVRHEASGRTSPQQPHRRSPQGRQRVRGSRNRHRESPPLHPLLTQWAASSPDEPLTGQVVEPHKRLPQLPHGNDTGRGPPVQPRRGKARAGGASNRAFASPIRVGVAAGPGPGGNGSERVVVARPAAVRGGSTRQRRSEASRSRRKAGHHGTGNGHEAAPMKSQLDTAGSGTVAQALNLARQAAAAPSKPPFRKHHSSSSFVSGFGGSESRRWSGGHVL